MKEKNIVVFCFFVVVMLLVPPVVVSSSFSKDQSVVQNIDTKKQGCEAERPSERTLGKGYLLIHVFTYTPGSGFHPYHGANISIRGILYSYNGTTDEDGDCFFTVHTKLFRAKIYFVKVSIVSQERVTTKRDFIYMLPRQIEYKEFLFVVFK
jgi:hypothetical protein